MQKLVGVKGVFVMTARDRGVPGNTLASQAMLDRLVSKTGVSVLRIEGYLEKCAEEVFILRTIKIAPPSHSRLEWFVVVRAFVEGEACVGFHSETTLGGALSGVLERIINQTMKWKADEYG